MVAERQACGDRRLTTVGKELVNEERLVAPVELPWVVANSLAGRQGKCGAGPVSDLTQLECGSVSLKKHILDSVFTGMVIEAVIEAIAMELYLGSMLPMSLSSDLVYLVSSHLLSYTQEKALPSTELDA